VTVPPKPAARPDRVSLWRHFRLFRSDILSAQPAKLYHALMAEFRTPFFRSYLCNDPALVSLVLKERSADFPKSDRVREGLAPLLGNSVFVTNGETWERQRRLIDPAFAGGRLHETFGAIRQAADRMVLSLMARQGQPIDIEEEASRAAADVIFRALFSVPIEEATAAETYLAFRDYQRSQPLLNVAAFIPLPSWMPRFHRRATRRAARRIRGLIGEMTRRRATEIAMGDAPDDLATKIMTARDPATGFGFDPAEMTDQVAIFFLAGHETSASALSWALYLLATHPEVQERAAEEARSLGPDALTFSDLTRLKFIRDVFRETLRLYPPVPMLVREARCPVTFRGRSVSPGAQVILSPWHLHRHDRFWPDPDLFRPERWRDGASDQAIRQAYLPFSAGPRVCPGAGFAMIEGPLLIAAILREMRISPADSEPPVPVAHLTVRARDGIRLAFLRRQPG
jgi:cytochrome P450